RTLTEPSARGCPTRAALPARLLLGLLLARHCARECNNSGKTGYRAAVMRRSIEVIVVAACTGLGCGGGQSEASTSFDPTATEATSLPGDGDGDPGDGDGDGTPGDGDGTPGDGDGDGDG